MVYKPSAMKVLRNLEYVKCSLNFELQTPVKSLISVQEAGLFVSAPQ